MTFPHYYYYYFLVQAYDLIGLENTQEENPFTNIDAQVFCSLKFRELPRILKVSEVLKPVCITSGHEPIFSLTLRLVLFPLCPFLPPLPLPTTLPSLP